MSVKVISAVMSHSEARLAARLVLLAIADNAEDGSGIGYPPIVDRREVPIDRRRSITHKTRLSEREVRNSIRELEELGELETRQAQRGRGRINVYRVKVGYLAGRDPQVEDLPFRLIEPFSTTGNLCRQSDGVTTGNPAPGLAADGDGDHRHSGPRTTGTPIRADRHGDEVSAAEPSVEPSHGPSAAEPSELSAPAVARLARAERRPVKTAAASESEPVSIEAAVSLLAKLSGWDTGSLAVVLPLLQQVPGTVFEETLAKAIERRAMNPPGMLVHLLRVAIGDWRQAQQEARLATWDEFFGEAGLERVKREDPDRYVLAWATPSLEAARPLPPALVVGHVLSYVVEHTGDQAERDRLLDLFLKATDRIPSARAVNDWILKALDRQRLPLDEVLATVDTFTAGNPQARDELVTFAREIHANVERDQRERAERAA